MASSSQTPSAKYDVFISFRGKDVRRGFLSHLKTKLKQKDIDVFVDERLESGDKISSALFRAIEKSKSSLVIFSENYAESTWCLDELVKIVDCMNTKKHIVIPVFLEIDPSNVRHQKVTYADAFAQHEKRHKEKVQSWRSALVDAASLSGIHYSESSCLSPKDEAELVERIVEALFRKLKGDSSKNMTMPTKQFGVNVDNVVKEFKNMEIADNNVDDSVDRDMSSRGQKKNKNKKKDLSSSSQVTVGVGDNKIIFSVTNSGQHQQKKPQNYSQSHNSYRSKQLDEYDENSDVSDDDEEYGVQGSSAGWQKNNKNKNKDSQVGANKTSNTVMNFQQHQQKKPQQFRPYNGWIS